MVVPNIPSSVPTKKVETYDIWQRREWTTEDDADINNGLALFAAVLYDETKVKKYICQVVISS